MGKDSLPNHKRTKRELVMSSEGVKSVIASVHLDQVLYDLVIRKSEYPRTPMVYGFLEDFFVYIMAQRMDMMFMPIDNTKLPEQLGKVIVTTMLQQTLVDRCRTLITTYPCEFLTEEDKQSCTVTRYTPCYPKDNPPVGYIASTWDMLRRYAELLSYRRAYVPGGNEPSLIIKTPMSTLRRRKRSPMRKLGLPKRRRGSSSSSSSSLSGKIT